MGRLPYLRGEKLATLAGIKTGLFTRMDPGGWHTDYALETGVIARQHAARRPA